MRKSLPFAITAFLLTGCAGGMGETVAGDTDEPASCKEGGDAVLSGL